MWVTRWLAQWIMRTCHTWGDVRKEMMSNTSYLATEHLAIQGGSKSGPSKIASKYMSPIYFSWAIKVSLFSVNLFLFCENGDSLFSIELDESRWIWVMCKIYTCFLYLGYTEKGNKTMHWLGKESSRFILKKK